MTNKRSKSLGILPTELLGSYMTVHQVAEKIGVSERRVCQFIKEGRLLAFRIGNSFLIAHDHFLAFATQKRKVGRPRKEN